MTEAQRIRKYYIRPPLSLIETDWQKRQDGCQFEIATIIWLDRKMPIYRVAIPENINTVSLPLFMIQTREVEYRATGRAIYDNTLPPAKAIVFEYELLAGL